MEPAPGASETFRVLSLDHAEAEYASLRLVGAVVTLAGAVALVALRPDVVGWTCAIAGVAFSAMWIGRWARARRMSDRRDEHFLALSPSHIELAVGDARTRVGWDAVEGIRVNEDRLVIEIARRDGQTLTIDPRYGGLGLYDLEEAVRSAWRVASDRRSAPGP